MTFLVIDADCAATHSLDTDLSNSLIFLRKAILRGLRVIADIVVPCTTSLIYFNSRNQINFRTVI